MSELAPMCWILSGEKNLSASSRPVRRVFSSSGRFLVSLNAPPGGVSKNFRDVLPAGGRRRSLVSSLCGVSVDFFRLVPLAPRN